MNNHLLQKRFLIINCFHTAKLTIVIYQTGDCFLYIVCLTQSLKEVTLQNLDLKLRLLNFIKSFLDPVERSEVTEVSNFLLVLLAVKVILLDRFVSIPSLLGLSALGFHHFVLLSRSRIFIIENEGQNN